MTGVDTNVLLRYLTQDDAYQSPIAVKAIERFTKDNPGFVSVVAMVEMSWSLRSFYRWTTPEIIQAIEHLLLTRTLVIQNAEQVFAAMIALQQDKASFSDALIAELGLWNGCVSTLTFDKKASRSSGFTLL